MNRRSPVKNIILGLFLIFPQTNKEMPGQKKPLNPLSPFSFTF